MSSEIAIEVNNLSKCYQIYEKPQDRLLQMLSRGKKKYFQEFWALKEISFSVNRGEAFGIVGRNGSGKSTLLQIIAGTLTPTSGTTQVNGRTAALLELGSGFNPEFTGRENVFLNGRILGLTQKEIEARYAQIVEFADIGEFIDQPVKTYSSGMFVRLAFAVQAHIDANVVIIDEALAVGDVFFRQKCYGRLEALRRAGAAILLVSHAMQEIEQYCERAILLEKGAVRFVGESSEATKRYYLLHQPSESILGVDKQYSKQPQIDTSNMSGNDLIFWPDSSEFIDASNIVQVSDGGARCTRFSLCNDQGISQSSFSQGETAIFYYEFEILRPIAVPLGGIVLQNDKGIVVHGKGSLEYASEAPDYLPKGTLVRCRQSIELKVGVGEYTFELGLASIDSESYKAKSALNHEILFSKIFRICHLPKAGMFNVGLQNRINGSQLTHHGVADLPGNFEFGFKFKETEVIK